MSGADLTHEQIIERFLKPGDTLTHTVCMGGIEEHIFTHRDGRGLCGVPTADTMRIEGMEDDPADNDVNDISPANVTHINRTAVECVPLMDDAARNRIGRETAEDAAPDGDTPPYVALTAEQAVQTHDWRTRRSAAGAWCFGAVPDYEVCRRCGLSKHYLESRPAPPGCEPSGQGEG